mmetsp:Transcript_4682/g.10326  ORF Transcript_4682/g.10326 Transcript_4682/m.10326 type:complete len:99 (-) Transcript_4682:242-538(-)
MITQDGERGIIALEKIHEVLPSQIFASQLPRAPNRKAGVVNAGGPPAEADSSGGPDDFSEAGGETGRESGNEGVEAVVVFGGVDVFTFHTEKVPLGNG